MKNNFSWRVFISFTLIWSFLILAFIGIILFLSPSGRYANWVTWRIFALKKAEWQALHTIFSFAFVIISALHLLLINWKVFTYYLKSKISKGINKRRELVVSFSIIIIFSMGVLFQVPPFSSVMAYGENLKESWEKSENEPPIPHAELLTLTQLSKQLKFNSATEIEALLKNKGIIFNDTLQTLQEIAALNHKTPNEIYNQLKISTEGARPMAGFGRRTLEDIVVELGKTPDEALTIWNNNGISVQKNQTLKQIGDNNNITPRELYEMISK